jgi:phosphoribosyl 1,2-cyclic phosphodiesterase
MSLFIASLNSGSNGNCYYIGNKEEAVLVDAGISCREVEKRLSNLGLSISKVKAVFISHEHGDHISGVTVLSRKHQLPVYITPATLKSSGLALPDSQVCDFSFNETVTIGALSITPFGKEHDAADPCSFIIEGNGVTAGVFTDIGIVCKQVVQYFKQCHAAFLESNYDEQMLEEGNYPFHLKRRIRGGKGHLSNTEALELLTNHRHENLSHLILAHLSKNNNNPLLVEKLFSNATKDVHICVAPRYHETPVFHIQAGKSRKINKKITTLRPMQLELFTSSEYVN